MQARIDRYFFDKDAVREPQEWLEKDKRKDRYHPLGTGGTYPQEPNREPVAHDQGQGLEDRHG